MVSQSNGFSDHGRVVDSILKIYYENQLYHAIFELEFWHGSPGEDFVEFIQEDNCSEVPQHNTVRLKLCFFYNSKIMWYF